MQKSASGVGSEDGRYHNGAVVEISRRGDLFHTLTALILEAFLNGVLGLGGGTSCHLSKLPGGAARFQDDSSCERRRAP